MYSGALRILSRNLGPASVPLIGLAACGLYTKSRIKAGGSGNILVDTVTETVGGLAAIAGVVLGSQVKLAHEAAETTSDVVGNLVTSILGSSDVRRRTIVEGIEASIAAGASRETVMEWLLPQLYAGTVSYIDAIALWQGVLNGEDALYEYITVGDTANWPYG